MFKKASSILDEIYENISLKNRIFYKLSSIIITSFIIAPILIMVIDLLMIFYEIQLLLIFIIVVLIFLFTFLYNKFLFDIYKSKIEINNKENIKYVYIINMIYPIILSIVFIICYIIVR